MGLLSSLFGGGSSSSSNATTNADNRNLIDASRGGAAASGSGRVTITNNSTDAGAVKNALDLARSSTAQAYKNSNDALGAVAKAYADSKGEGSQLAQYALIGAAVVAGLAVMSRMGR